MPQTPTLQAFRFRVWGLGFKVLGLGFRVWGLGFLDVLYGGYQGVYRDDGKENGNYQGNYYRV